MPAIPVLETHHPQAGPPALSRHELKNDEEKEADDEKKKSNTERRDPGASSHRLAWHRLVPPWRFYAELVAHDWLALTRPLRAGPSHDRHVRSRSCLCAGTLAASRGLCLHHLPGDMILQPPLAFLALKGKPA